LLRQVRPAHRYDGGDVVAWQRSLRRKLKGRLGWRHFAHGSRRVRLKPRTLWRRETGLGWVEKVAFTAEPGADVVGYWCVPHGASPPHPTVICLQGHSTGMHLSIGVDGADETTPIEVPGDRDFCLTAMRRGLAALAIEQRSFGERGERRQARIDAHNPCQDAAMHALQLGRTLLAERVYDVDRAVDYLLQRGESDPGRLGVMGNSGGGTVSMFAAAILRRVRFAMPSCCFCTFADSIMSIHHCGDNYVPGLLREAEMAEAAGLIAPRPVVMVNGEGDEIFPIEASRREFKRLKRIYRAAGAAGQCVHVVGPEGHRFYADLAWPELMKRIAG